MNKPIVAPSEITCVLVEQLIQRDAFGQAKYGASLDRKDFSIEQWLQHQTEELLDGAGYAQAALREITKLKEELRIANLKAAEYNHLHAALRAHGESLDRHGRIHLNKAIRIHEADLVLRSLQK